MSAAVSDVYCHSCSRLYAAAQFPAAFNDENDRICPQCSSEFVELRDAPVAVGPSVAGLPNMLSGAGTNTTRRVFTTPNGLNMELHVTTAVLPPELLDMLSRSGSQGVSMVFSLDNAGSLIPGGNLRGFTFGDAELEVLLDRLAQQYRPPIQPTSQHVVNALPRRHVRSGEAEAVALSDTASCRPGEPCSVCHDEFAEGTTVVELPCQHCFHEDCILPWLREHNTCPVCRFKLEEDATSTSGSTTSNQRPADAAPDEDDPPGGSSLDFGWQDRHAPRRPRAPRSNRAGPGGGPTGEASPSMASSSMHPVRSSPGAAFVRSGPYTRLEEGTRADAAGSRAASSQEARVAPSDDSGSQDVNELVNRFANLASQRQAIQELAGRIDSLTQQNSSSRQAISDLTARIGSITQRNASNQQAFHDLLHDISRLTQRRQSLMGNAQELHASHRHLRERMESLLQQSQLPSTSADTSAPPTQPSTSTPTSSASEAVSERPSELPSEMPGRARSTHERLTAVLTERLHRAVQQATESPAAPGAGGHMGDWELRAFEQDISRAAALAESILGNLPPAAAAQSADGADTGPAASSSSGAVRGQGDAAAPEAAAVGIGEVVIVSMGDPREPSALEVPVPAMRAPLLARVVQHVLRWAFRSVRRLFGFLR